MSTKYFTTEDAYKQNKDLKKEDVLLLQEWMDKQPHLPKITEMKLIIFMHACYYKIEASKICIDNYFTLKAHWPEFALQRNVFSEDLQQASQVILATVLPMPTKENHAVMYGRLFDSDPDIFHDVNFVKLFDMILTACMRVEGTSEGHVLIIDPEGLTLSHIIKINLMTLKKYLYYVQDALPVRLKAVHIIHVGPVFNKLFGLAKPFLRKELFDIIHLYAKMDSLFDHIHKVSLPNELGGEAGTYEELHAGQMEILKENAEYLLREENEIADESKRQVRSKYYDEMFGGVEGTFKKLDID